MLNVSTHPHRLLKNFEKWMMSNPNNIIYLEIKFEENEKKRHGHDELKQCCMQESGGKKISY
jgi:hypothetical protein